MTDERTKERTEKHACDLIYRQAAIDAFDSTNELIVGGEANARNVVNYINKVVGKIKDLPSAQPEIIRCRDCAKYKTVNCAMDVWMSDIRIYTAKPDDFCSKAERRQNG